LVDRPPRPLYRSTLVDDLLMAQPLNAVARWERSRALRRGRAGDDSYLSVVIVSYNTLPVLRTCLAAVRELSPVDTEIVVVDNGSRDGSREWLRASPFGTRVVLLPTNLGHGRALDIGICRSTGSNFVTLDSDAFPVSADWLRVVCAPLREGAGAAGWKGPRDRLHPALAAMPRAEYFKLGLSFAGFRLTNVLLQPEFGVDTWDTGELISEAVGPDRMVLFDSVKTEFGGRLIPGLGYHHCGMTTMITDGNDQRKGTGHESLWDRAVAAYLSPVLGHFSIDQSEL